MNNVIPNKVRIEAASICQLKCPICKTTTGEIRNSVVGKGILEPAKFELFLKNNRFIRSVELSNWGEMFLNSKLPEIFRIAYENDVTLTASNGVNLNTASLEALESLVKYNVKHLTCSIDGATNHTYAKYRVNGNLEQVLSNIRTINHFKQVYLSDFPLMTWQYIVFGHNEHEISQARILAYDLGMSFKIKLSYAADFSPINNIAKVRQETGMGVASRQEFAREYGDPYKHRICHQLWHSPQINYDGEVLGCCINHWKSFGNAFDKDLSDIINSDTMNYTREVLMGNKPCTDDIPCTSCYKYKELKESGRWLKPPDHTH